MKRRRTHVDAAALDDAIEGFMNELDVLRMLAGGLPALVEGLEGAVTALQDVSAITALDRKQRGRRPAPNCGDGGGVVDLEAIVAEIRRRPIPLNPVP